MGEGSDERTGPCREVDAVHRSCFKENTFCGAMNEWIKSETYLKTIVASENEVKKWKEESKD